MEESSSPKAVIQSSTDPSSTLVQGVVHGWVHKPHLNRENLLAHTWNLFILANKKIDFNGKPGIKAYMTIDISFPSEHYDSIRANIGKEPKPATTTPPLPKSWTSQSRERSVAIPQEHVLPSKSSLGVGELRLDPTLTTFLSTALPGPVKDAPVSLFNLFQYKCGDRAVHDSYMEGFKRYFGDTAGAQVKFMGPYGGAEMIEKGGARKAEAGKWQDANLVQYDSIWHYAYMLSTVIYKKLNKEKVAGLDDTCILLVSETQLL